MKKLKELMGELGILSQTAQNTKRRLKVTFFKSSFRQSEKILKR